MVDEADRDGDGEVSDRLMANREQAICGRQQPIVNDQQGIYLYIYLKRFAQSAGPGFQTSASFLTHFYVHGVSFGVTFAISSSFWELFGNTFCIKESIGAPKLPQEVPRGEMQKSTHTFWSPFLTHFSHIFKTRVTFVHVFSTRCSSHAFLVYLCTFSGDLSTHFVCHVICARSDLDCTGIAQTHVLTFERPEKLQKNIAEKYSDLKLHFEWILAPFWVHIFAKIAHFGANGSAQN